VTEKQQADFHRFMLQDLERLDTLINHMLDAARLDPRPLDGEVLGEVDLTAMLASCAETACLRYHLPVETIKLDVAPVFVRAQPIDVEMIFRNLIDNAIKYGGNPPQVEVRSQLVGDDRVRTRITDNGQGIPAPLRRKIFGRFVRLGNELERARTGTGLGLFIVRTLVTRLRGEITVRDRGAKSGTTFEVELPGGAQAVRATGE
jgi:signal transduction histidine kinase